MKKYFKIFLVVSALLLVFIFSSLHATALSTFNATPQTVYPGQTITTTFSTQTLTSTAWIGFYDSTSNDNSYISWSYLDGLNGVYSVEAPRTPGNYNFRIFSMSYEKVQTSNDIQIIQFTPTFEVSSSNVISGNKLLVSYSNASTFSDSWIGFYNKNSNDNTYISWAYLMGASGTYEVTAPMETGDYNFRIFINDYTKIGTSQDISIKNSAPTFNLSTQSVVPNEKVTVNYSNSPIYSSAWIGLYKESANDNSYISWAYTDGKENGSYEITSPIEPGKYNFRIFQTGYSKVGTSPSFEVSGFSSNLTLSSQELKPGDKISVSYDNSPTLSGAWIGLYKENDSDKSYISWAYTNGNSNGNYEVTAPLEPGKYNFRLFQSEYNKVATSQSFLVSEFSANFTLSKSKVQPNESLYVNYNNAPTTSGSWIGLFKVDTPNTSYLDWKYLDGSSGKFDINAPFDLGLYEFRIFKDGGYILVSRSPSFEVATTTKVNSSSTTFSGYDLFRESNGPSKYVTANFELANDGVLTITADTSSETNVIIGQHQTWRKLDKNINSIEGRWERYGDGGEGTIVNVINTFDGFAGTVEKVTGTLIDLGFVVGDIKWKNLSSSVSTSNSSNSSWEGVWSTDYGDITFTSSEGMITGNYSWDSGQIYGFIDENMLIGTWSEYPYTSEYDSGDIYFTMSSDGNSFTGLWRYGKTGDLMPWNGFRKSNTINPNDNTVPDNIIPDNNLDEKSKLKISTNGLSVFLEWMETSNKVGLEGYNLYRGTEPGMQDPTPITDFAISETQHEDLNVETGNTYYYIVKAVYQDGKEVQISDEASIKIDISNKKNIVLKIDSTTFSVNGKGKALDAPPTIVNSRTLLPIRAVMEELGGNIQWVANERKVILALNDTVIELWIDSKTTKVNGIEKMTDVPPQIINSRTMLPLRFISDNFGFKTKWSAKEKTITILY